MLRNINLHGLSLEQLEGIETALNVYLCKQPDFGEPWHPSYRKNPQSFADLIKQTATLQQIVRKYMLSLKLAFERLADLVIIADEKSYALEQFSNFINQHLSVTANVEFANKLNDGLSPIYTNGARAAMQHIKISSPISETSASASDWLSNYSLKLAKDINQTTTNDIQSAITTSIKLGETKEELSARIDQIIDDPYRSEMIAQTESVRVYSQARIDVGQQSGYKFKRWENGQDGACEYCDGLDGQVVGIDELFDGGIDSVDGPPLHPNCKCGPPTLLMNDDDSSVSGRENKRSIKADDWVTINGTHVDFDGTFDSSGYRGLSQSAINDKVSKQVADQGSGLADTVKDFDWSVSTVNLDDVAKVAVDSEKLNQFTADIIKGAKLPLALVTSVGDRMETIDGNHRLQAAQNIGMKSADVLLGRLKS